MCLLSGHPDRDKGSEAEMLQVARSCSGEQIERLARGIRRAKALDDPDAAAARYGMTWRRDDDGTVVLTARLPVEQAAVILAALDTCREQLEQAAQRDEGESSAEDAPPRPPAPTLPMFGPPSRTPVRSSAESLPPLPVSSAEELDSTGTITADTCPNPWAADRLHLAYAVSVLMHLAA